MGEASITTLPRSSKGAGSASSSVAWWVFCVVAAVCLLRGVGEFAYDARAYWHANLAVLGAGELTVADYFDLRGVWTAVTFVPSALATAAFGESAAGISVLSQNSVMIAWTAAFLVPRAVALWQAPSTRTRWAGAALVCVGLQGFAPYPMVDLYAAVAALAAVVLLAARSGGGIAAAGALLAYAVNLRPAYVPVVVLLVLAAAMTGRWRSAWAIPGAAVALAPQVVANLVRHGTFSVTPFASENLVALQASFAAFVVRYDTAPGREASPQQFFCSPSMASGLDSLPTTTAGLVSAYLRHLPESLLFAVEKIGAALHWPLSIPYLVARPGVDALFAVTITLVAVVGCTYLVVSPLMGRADSARRGKGPWASATAVVVASVATLAGSATEARFALPLVLLGVVGVAGLAGADKRVRFRHRWVVGGAVLLAVGLVAAGYAGLAHPAPPGPVSQAMCGDT